MSYFLIGHSEAMNKTKCLEDVKNKPALSEKMEVCILKVICDSNLECHLCDGDKEQKAVELELKKNISVFKEVQK